MKKATTFKIILLKKPQNKLLNQFMYKIQNKKPKILFILLKTAKRGFIVATMLGIKFRN